MEHLGNMKRELRQRKALTMLQNVKATKIRANQLRNSDLNQEISLAQFK